MSDVLAAIKACLLPDEEKVHPFYFAGRAIVFLGLAVWGWRFITNTWQSSYVMESFMHHINLPFHEAGHFLFRPFGRFLHVLGGSLGQLLMPLVCLGTFLYQQNPFGGTVALWWFAQNLMDLAPYIGDARAGELPLLGGVTGSEVEDYHDWEYLLKQLGWLYSDHKIAAGAYMAGRWLMVLAFAWGAVLLYRQYKNLDRN
ncbi:MAG: zinc ribbon domain-containing protein [Nitrospirae bacterium]|nr:MAG: zinc ribbon domain-containing protein [Nitrospirota bacterium]